MKPNIHPELKSTNYICVCGANFMALSTRGGVIKLDICSQCHPTFVGGESKIVDTAGRIERFNQKYKKKN